jgi:hypothetical protein
MKDRSTKVLVASRVSRSEHTALVRLAEANDRTMSREIRRAIMHHLERQAVPAP